MAMVSRGLLPHVRSLGSEQLYELCPGAQAVAAMKKPEAVPRAAFCTPVPLTANSCALRARPFATRRLRPASTAKRRRVATCAFFPWAKPAPRPVVLPANPFPRNLLVALRGASPAYALTAAACLVFYLVWTLSMRRKNAKIRQLELAAAADARRPMAVFEDDDVDEVAGDNALWLNLSLFPSVSRCSQILSALSSRLCRELLFCSRG